MSWPWWLMTSACWACCEAAADEEAPALADCELEAMEAVVADDGFSEVVDEDGVSELDEAEVVEVDDVVVVPSLFWCTTS